MSVRENAAVVATFTEALRSGDIAACEALLDEANVFSEAPSLPFGGDYVGRDGFRQMLREVSKRYSVELEKPEIAAAGPEKVLVAVRGTFTARASGRTMPVDCLDLYEVREGRIVRVDVYYKDSAAVAELLRHAEPDLQPSSQRDRGE